MSFTRNTVIDASPSGDSVKQAVLDLDADLTASFDGLNQIQAGLALKIDQSAYNQANGVPRLDASGKIASAQLPSTAPDLPVGLIAAFAAEALPDDANWLECDGAQLSMADYAALYAVIGNTFGLGNPGYFVLPDLRGRFLRGFDHSAGRDPEAGARTGGDHVGSTQADQFKAHTHQLVGVENTGKASGGESVIDPGRSQDKVMNNLSTVGGLETRPANIAVLYCIKWR